jgi:hypothetical protein
MRMFNEREYGYFFDKDRACSMNAGADIASIKTAMNADMLYERACRNFFDKNEHIL